MSRVVADEPNHDMRCCFVSRFGQNVSQSEDPVWRLGLAPVRARGGRAAGARSRRGQLAG
jgi:hypothetical protein